MACLTLEFPVPTLPLSENESRRMHWAARRRRLDPWKDAVVLSWLQVPKKKRQLGDPPFTVRLELPFARRARRDPHNYVGTVTKACVDALTRKAERVGNREVLVFGGAWPDDTPEWVTVEEPVLTVGDTARMHISWED